MGIQNFFDSFMHGFAFGTFNANPFMGCCSFNFNSFNFFPPVFDCMYAVPNIMAQFSCMPMIHTTPAPDFMNFSNNFSYQNSWDNSFSMPTFQNDINIFDKFFPNKELVVQPRNYYNNFVGDMFVPSMQSNSQVSSDVSVSSTSSKSTSSSVGKMTATTINDKHFDKMLNFVLSQEGGYVNDPVDSGGETNKGIIKSTYDGYRKSKNLPIQSVKNITDEEVKEIYYNIYKECGADKIDNPQVAFMIFDIAVGSGSGTAKRMFKESGGDLKKLEQMRRDFYADIVRRKPDQKKFIKGWNNRVTHAMEFVTKNLPESSMA